MLIQSIKGLHHDHVDGSMAMSDIILDLYKAAGKDFPFASHEEWLKYFRNPHEDLVKKFGTVTGVLQSAEALELAGYAYGRRRANEGYEYVEAKFAPQYHTFGGLTLGLAVDAMLKGLFRAEMSHNIRILPHLCIGREAAPEVGVEIAMVALGYGAAVALDMACDEAGHPPEKHLAAYQLTFGSKVKRDCHAGEWVAKEPAETYRERLLKNVRTAVYDLKCDGIGHAIPLCDDTELIHYMVDNGIRVAGNPLSNLACGVIKDVRELRIDELLDAGLIYTLNPDDDLFLPAMPDVEAACDAAYGFDASQVGALRRNVFRGAFAKDVRTES